jgi:HPt (histidine-containing phosphotransfer) domain-containing protein
MYLAESDRFLDSIDSALETGDMPALQGAAHALASSSAMVGALALAQLGGEIEELASKAEADRARSCAHKLRREYARVRAALGRIAT